jgi:hypothetical protein
MNSLTWQPPPDTLQQQKTRRDAVLLGASAIMGTAGMAALAAVIGWEVPAFPTSAASAHRGSDAEAVIAGPEPRALSTVNQAIVQSYRDRYAIFGDTSQVAVVLMDDVNKQEVELPRLMMQGAFKAIDPRTARGDLLEAYGHYKTFVADFLDRDDPGATSALELYNPYSYLPSLRYQADRDRRRDQLHEPEELFAAAFTVWRLSPDAFIDRYQAMPMVPAGNEREATTGNGPTLQPSWEKQLALMAAENILLFASALVKTQPEMGEGVVNTRLAQVAPRLGIVKFQMDL